MSAGRLSGIGLLMPPLAFAVYQVLGFWLTQARCGAAAVRFALDAWTVAASAVTAALIVVGGLASLAAWRATRHKHDDPPAARIHFLAVMGLAIAPLVLVIVAMQGLGVLVLEGCVQS